MSDEEPQALRPTAPLAAGAPRCTAVNDRGQPCGQAAVAGTTKCYYHGGASPKGIAAPAYRTGKYSKYLPAKMVAHYEAALADDDILSLQNELALADSLLIERTQRLGTGESGAAWRDLTKRMRDYVRARETHIKARDGMTKEQAAADMNLALLDMEEIILHGAREDAAQVEIREWFETRRKLSESEQKRLERAGVVIDVREARAMLQVVALRLRESVDRWVDDKKVREAILGNVQDGLSRFTRDARQQHFAAPGDGERGVQDDVPE